MKSGSRETIVKLLLCLTPMLIYFVNVLLGSVDFSANRWNFPGWVPALNPPLGADFKANYDTGQLLLNGKSPYSIPYIYPPFVPVFFKPLATLSYHAAYLVQACLLLAANIGAILLAVRTAWLALADGTDKDGARPLLDPWLVSLSFMAVAITGYPFMFSVERGNYDIYPQFFCVLFLWLLLRHGNRVWLQAIALSIAIHLKLYPAALVPLMLWRHTWRCLLPLAAVNTVLLFITGYQDTQSFFQQMSGFAAAPYMWIGNHSSLAFANIVLGPLGFGPAEQNSPYTFGFPLAVWFVGCGLLAWRGYTPRRALLMFALSIPIMSVLPGTSHDYKLVILYAPAAILAGGALLGFMRGGRFGELLRFAAVAYVTGWLSRSYVVTGPLYLQNKYPFVVLLELLALATVVFPGAGFAEPASAGERGEAGQSKTSADASLGAAGSSRS